MPEGDVMSGFFSTGGVCVAPTAMMLLRVLFLPIRGVFVIFIGTIGAEVPCALPFMDSSATSAFRCFAFFAFSFFMR
jgi:hypothetical protein